MKSSTSVYLDAARFLAAFVVFLGHASRGWATGDLFPTYRAYDQTAVIVFFIISGFVIAEVAPRSSMRRYLIDRVTRLYSVALPAAAITIVCTVIVAAMGPPALSAVFPIALPEETVRLLASLLFVNRSWYLALEPTVNIPWWSISFEVFYYAIFLLFFYFRGLAARLLVLAIALAAGPKVISLLPLWLLGFLLHRICASDRLRVGPVAASVLLVAGLSLLLVAPKVAWHYPMALAELTRPMLYADYCGGIGFALTVYAVNALPDRVWPSLPALTAAIRWLASLTFSLYLFHFPIIVAVCALYPSAPTDTDRRLLIVAVPALVVLAIGRWCERSRLPMRRALLRRWPG